MIRLTKEGMSCLARPNKSCLWEPRMGLVEMGLQENQKLGTAWTIGDAGSHCMRSWRACSNDMKSACLNRRFQAPWEQISTQKLTRLFRQDRLKPRVEWTPEWGNIHFLKFGHSNRPICQKIRKPDSIPKQNVKTGFDVEAKYENRIRC